MSCADLSVIADKSLSTFLYKCKIIQNQKCLIHLANSCLCVVIFFLSIILEICTLKSFEDDLGAEPEDSHAVILSLSHGL